MKPVWKRIGKGTLVSACAAVVAMLLVLLPVTGVSAAGSWTRQRDGQRATDFTDVTWVTAGVEGWAVGTPETASGGAVYDAWHTTDGGVTWDGVLVLNGPYAPLASVVQMQAISFRNASLGWTCGTSGIISKYSGGTWSVKRMGGSTELLTDIVATSDAEVWAAGADSAGSMSPVVLKSDDAGETWKDVTLNSTSFFDESDGWAVGNSGAIIRTTDGGTTWAVQTSGTSNNLKAVKAINTNEAWVAGENGTLLRTGNAGTTWSSDFGANAVCSRDATHTWIAGQNGLVMFFNGFIWTEQNPSLAGTPVVADLTAVDFATDLYGWVVGDGGTALYTLDGGATWTSFPTAGGEMLKGVDVTNTGGDAYRVSVCADAGYFAYTSQTIPAAPTGWTAATTPPPAQNLKAIEFQSAVNGYIAGSSGTMVYTMNGGVDWTAATVSGGTPDFTALSFTGTGDIWFATAEDGGIWQSRGNHLWAAMDINGMASPTASINYYVGNAGAIVKRDGAVFTVQESCTPQNLKAIAAVDSSTLAAVGDGDTFLWTTDGGTNWTLHATGLSTKNWNAVSVVNSGGTNYITVVSDGGIIQRTTDGFAGWVAPVSVPAGTPDLKAVRLLDKDIGWALGASGTVWQTMDGSSATPHWSEVHLNDCFSFGADDTTFVGDGGTIIHWNATSQTAELRFNETTWTTENLKSVYFRGPNHGYAVGDNGTVVEYDDTAGGWKAPIQVGTAVHPDLKGVHVLDPDAGYGYAVGSSGGNGYYVQLTNGTWGDAVQIGTTVHPPLNAVYLTASNAGYAVGDGGYYTELAAGTWGEPAQVGGANPKLNGVYVNSTDDVYAVGNGGYYAHQTAPATWTVAQVGGANPDLYDIARPTTNGWAVGGTGGVGYRVPVSSGTFGTPVSMGTGSRELRGISQSADNTGFACGLGRTVASLKGTTWAIDWAIPSNAADFNSFSIVPGQPRGWAAGNGGAIYMMIVGLFKSQNSHTTGDLRAVSAPAVNVVFAVGEEGTRTTYNGTSWTAGAFADGNDLLATDFFNSSIVTVAGAGRTIWTTTNGGTNWSSVSGVNKTTYDLLSIDFADVSNGWMCGGHGLLYRYSNGAVVKQDPAGAGDITDLRGIGVYSSAGPTYGGIVAGDNRTIYSSSDGDTWTLESQLALSSAITFYGATAPTAYDAWFAGYQSGGSPGGYILGYRQGIFAVNDPGAVTQVYRGISVVDNGGIFKGAAVGDNGRVRYTDDSGLNWHDASITLPSPTPNLNSVSSLGGHFVLCGTGGLVRRSIDYGATWTAPGTSPVTTSDLYGSDMATDGGNENAWVVGANGACFNSTDAGDIWAAQTSGVGSVLRSVSAYYDAVGSNFDVTAVGDLRTILDSSDAGATWSTISNIPGNALTHIGAASTNDVFFSGVSLTAGGQVVATDNDGITFNVMPTGLGLLPQFNSIYVLDATHFWVAGGSTTTPGVILYYSAPTWTSLVSTGTSDLEIDDIAVSNGVGVAVGQGGAIYMADDATVPLGSPYGWAALTTGKNPMRNDLKSVWFQWPGTGDGFCVAAGSQGTMGVNVDLTAKEWGFMMGPGDKLYGSTFLDADTGWACGGHGTVFKTTNGGTTWTPLNTQVTNDLLSITASDATHLWAVGKGGLVLFSGDGGDSWSSQDIFTTVDINGVFAVGPANAWLVGALDGGEPVIRHWDGVWNTVTTAPAIGSTLRSVNANGTHVWASGGDTGNNVVICSDDNGSTWQDVSEGSFHAPLNSVCVASAGATYEDDQVWATGGQSVLKWNGSSWDYQNVGSLSAELKSISFDRDRGAGPSDISNGWAVGTYSGSGEATILQTTNGGASWTSMASNTYPMKNLYNVSTVWNGSSSNWDCFAVGDWGRIQKLNNTPARPDVTLIDTPAPVGDSITLTGTNFGSWDPANDHVYFNNTVAGTIETPATDWTNTQIEVTVPPGAFGAIKDVHVVNAGGSSEGIAFTTTVTISPVTTPITGGNTVTVNGTGFGSDPGAENRSTAADHVAIGTFNVPYANVTAWAQDQVTFIVPNDSPPGTGVAVEVSRGGSFSIVTTEVRPTVTGINPTSGRCGTSSTLITVSGTNFGTAPGSGGYDADNCVKLGSMNSGGTASVSAAPFGALTDWTDTSISFNIPTAMLDPALNAWTGAVKVKRGLSESSATNPTLTVFPRVTAVAPLVGPVATTVTITGTAFGESENTGRHVYFNNVEATPVTWTWNQVKANVPANATAGPVKVTTSQGDSNLDKTFSVLPVTSVLSSTSGRAGDNILITGSGFGATKGTSSVTFNGVTAATTAWSVSSITATVPNAATTGNVVVTTTSGGSTGIAFTVMPKITSIDPPTSRPGEPITINGFTFGNTQGTGKVMFGTVQADIITSWSANIIKVIVPVGTATWNVTVVTPDGTSNVVPFGVGPVITAITGIDPASGPPGAVVNIIGNGFKDSRGDSTVAFNGTAASEFQSWSDTAIAVKVPLGATSGDVVVTTSGGASNGRSFTVGPARTYYFAEGTTRPNFQMWLSMMNPNESQATVRVTYMMADGTTSPQEVLIPPMARSTTYVPDVIGLNKDVSARVESDKPIVAERPMYFNYLPAYAPGQQWNGGHNVVGALATGTEWYFAEGTTMSLFEEWICLLNPTTQTAHVQVQYMPTSGQTVNQGVDIGPTTRKTIDVRGAIGPNVDCSAKVVSDVGIIAERAMYFNYQGDGNNNWTGGHDVVGANRPWTDWYFAEGTTRTGFDEWVCLQNPGDAQASVKLQYSLTTGENPNQVVMVPAHSRQTVNVPGFLGRGKDTSLHVMSDKPIVAERPMYFNYKPGTDNWNGGSDVIGANDTAHEIDFAEGATQAGFQEYLCIQNPNTRSISVTITYMLGTGPNRTQTVQVGALSRFTVDVNAFIGPGQDVSAKVTCNDPMMAERSMYFNYQGSTHLNWTGGHGVIGLSF